MSVPSVAGTVTTPLGRSAMAFFTSRSASVLGVSLSLFFSLRVFLFVVCVCVCVVGIQFSVLAALNVSELSCSPSFLPLFFKRRLLQSPIAYGFQNSDVIFFLFSCVSVACFLHASLLSNTGFFFD